MGHGDALGLDKLEQRRRIVAAWIDLFDAGQRSRPGKSPGVNMEHRRDGHVDVSIVKPTVPDCSEGGAGR